MRLHDLAGPLEAFIVGLSFQPASKAKLCFSCDNGELDALSMFKTADVLIPPWQLIFSYRVSSAGKPDHVNSKSASNPMVLIVVKSDLVLLGSLKTSPYCRQYIQDPRMIQQACVI
jgi:hypothetical protein